MTGKIDRSADHGRGLRMALSRKAQADYGEALEALGYTLVEITHSEDEDGDLMPEIEGDVDGLYFTWDVFPSAAGTPDFFKSPKKVAHARDVVVPRVKAGWVHAPSAGLDTWAEVFSASALDGTEGGIRLTHSPVVWGYAMGEYCCAHVLSLAKLIPAHIEQHKERTWKTIMQRSLNTQTLGILGCGGIGLHTAKLIRGFGMRIIGTTRRCEGHTVSADVPAGEGPLSPDELALIDEWFPADEAGTLELLRRSDFCICCLPLTPATREVISSRHFEALGAEGYFINVARGDVVDQDALIAALNSGTIAGAVVDVTTPEPLPPEHPLWLAKNLLITPHDSPAAQATFARGAEYFLAQARRNIKKEPLAALVSDVANAVSSNKPFW